RRSCSIFASRSGAGAPSRARVPSVRSGSDIDGLVTAGDYSSLVGGSTAPRDRIVRFHVGFMLIECIPNVSEGRPADVVAAIADAIRGVPGIRLLDVSSDASHNRSVFTFAGDRE